MTFLDFIVYDNLLKVLKDVLCITACIGLYFFIQWLVNDKNKRGE